MKEVSACNVYLHILCMIEPGKGMRFSSSVKHLRNMYLSLRSPQIQIRTTNALDGLLVAMAKSEIKTCFDAGKIGFCHCALVVQAQVPKLCTNLDLSLLYILILGTCSKFARKINFAALGVY